MGETMVVRLREVDADSILAALEWALNNERPDESGQTLDGFLAPGLYRRGVEEAARRIESVAALRRQGIEDLSIVGLVPAPHGGFTGKCPCGCGVEFRDGEQVRPDA